jgi:hypothetical protein
MSCQIYINNYLQKQVVPAIPIAPPVLSVEFNEILKHLAADLLRSSSIRWLSVVLQATQTALASVERRRLRFHLRNSIGQNNRRENTSLYFLVAIFF